MPADGLFPPHRPHRGETAVRPAEGAERPERQCSKADIPENRKPACRAYEFRQAERLAEEQRGLFCRAIDSNGEKKHEI